MTADTTLNEIQAIAAGRLNGDHGGALVQLASGNQLDAFSRLRVSNPVTLFDSQSQYDVGPLIWQNKLTTNGTVTHLPNESTVRMNVTTDDGSNVIRQTRQYIRYQSGKSQYIYISLAYGAATSGCTKDTGYGDAENGILFRQSGDGSLSIVKRSKITGSVVETVVAQADWSVDAFGAGTLNPSADTLDGTKAQLLWIDLEWLSVGRVRVGFQIHGVNHTAHEFNHSNTADGAYMTTANLPIRYEITGTGTAGNMKAICSQVSSEGGFSEDLATPFSTGNGVTEISVSTRRAILSIRPKGTFNSIANRGLIIPVGFGVIADVEAAYVEWVYNGVLGGTPSWASVNDDSIVEFDVAGTTVTGGIRVREFAVIAAVQGNRLLSSREAEDHAARLPLVLDIDGSNPTHLSIVVTGRNAGTTSVSGDMSWLEIR